MACNDNRMGWVYNEFHSLPPHGWERSDSLCFQTDSITKNGHYILSLHLRTGGPDAYPYRHLTLIVQQEWLPSSPPSIDTLKVAIIDEKGISLGKGISVFQYDIPFDTLSLSEGQQATLKLKHHMFRNPIPGITNVGFSLRELETES
jgi:gliding motility-associated lipoprotein GldH